jgi:flagellar hook-length control protein FliK
MNLFSHIVNAPAAKSPLADAASLGQAAARAEQYELGSTDFSKHFRQLLEAKTPAKPLDMQRQDLAAPHALGTNDKASERHDLIARDARFDSPKARNAPPRSAQKGEEQQNSQDDAHDRVSSRTENADGQRAVKRIRAQNADESEKVTGSLDNDAAAQIANISAEDGSGLKSIQLGPQVQVLTVDSPATTDESLAAFARSMGMADSTIQQLLGGGHGLTPGSDKTNLLQTPTAGIIPPTTAWPAGSLLQGLMGSSKLALPANPLADLSSAGIAANAQPLQEIRSGLMDGVDLVSLQIGPMAASSGPAQVLTAQSSSTLAVLSMLDTQFSPEAIDALQKDFEASTSTIGEEAPGNGPSFGVPGVKVAHSNGTVAPNAMSAAAQATHMAETYEKLSDKLATELAARLHQQISDGQWKMKFALKPASLGAVDIQLEMRDGKLAALFQADNPLTQDLLQNGSQRLKDALHNLGMTQTSVLVGQGQAQSHSQGQSQTSSDSAKFGDNRGQTQNLDPNAPADIGRRRASDSQFDIYA